MNKLFATGGSAPDPKKPPAKAPAFKPTKK